MKNDKNDSTGTARTLHEMSEIENLEQEYGHEVAISVATTAIQRKFPQITINDVRGFVRVTSVMRTGNIDIAKEHQLINEKAEAVATDIMSRIKNNKSETV